ncbi:MAG: 30S ribosomal protein S6 [Gammaproteobacteria bacterium]|nr:MAG: 30S ribosomal protein S6 [Gammaproteobacteria bacterium]|tara:strand:+ start:6562 stop:7017 length:456 start_codon:yes stop_codon:yes gene_type:complete
MNHYEIVFVVDPQLDTESKLFNKCLDTVKSIDGLTHRSEDIGIRKLAYPINDKNTGHYFLLNIECDPKKLKDVEALFKFDESIMRSSLVKKKRAETEPSSLLTQTVSQLKSDVPSEPIVDVKKNIEEEKKSEEKIIEKSKKEAVESDSESS